MMRIPMPDGTTVFILPTKGGVMFGTQGMRQPDGKMPMPQFTDWVSVSGCALGTFIHLLDKAGVVPLETEHIFD